MSTQKELPRYRCHKEVWALKINKIVYSKDNSGVWLYFEDKGYSPIKESYEYGAKHNPHPGGYYVVYKDGYKSWSPSKEFEEGYSLCSLV